MWMADITLSIYMYLITGVVANMLKGIVVLHEDGFGCSSSSAISVRNLYSLYDIHLKPTPLSQQVCVQCSGCVLFDGRSLVDTMYFPSQNTTWMLTLRRNMSILLVL